MHPTPSRRRFLVVGLFEFPWLALDFLTVGSSGASERLSAGRDFVRTGRCDRPGVGLHAFTYALKACPNAIVFKLEAVEPLFYYYGRKKQIARHYPPPNYQTIVEPFAGAASYSLHANNWRRQVILVERDRRVAAIWRWLIDEATPSSILALPDLRAGEKSSDFLHIIHAATKMAFKYKTIKATPVLERNWEISRRVMAASVHKVKHWSLIEGDYTRVPNIEATWFLDPPYKAGPGQGYNHGSSALDYEALAKWALERKGQLIFCEGEFGDYLPFRPLLQLAGVAGKRSREVVYYGAGEHECQRSLFGELTFQKFIDQQTTPSTLSKTST